jgi:hypothetical protein
VAGWEGSAAEDEEEVLGCAGQGLAGAVGPVEVGGAELDVGEVHAEVLELAGIHGVQDVVHALRGNLAVDA